MKKVLFSLCLLALLVACKSEVKPNEVNMDNLQGTFVRVGDNGRGGKEADKNARVEKITFRSKFCNFTYDGTPMSGKYSIDEGYVYIEAGGELGTLSLEIISGNQLEGEGLINGTFMRKGHEDEVKHGTGSGHGAGTSSENDDASDKEENAENDANSSNSDAEKSSPTGHTIQSTVHDANKTGGGNTAGNSGAPAEQRTVVTHLNTSNMRSGAAATIAMVLTINADGMVVGTQLDRAKTTSKNEVLINSVTEAVRKEVRYNKVPGASNTKVSYVVKL